jgi:hypothetical protein
VNLFWQSLYARLAKAPLIRRAAEVLFRTRAPGHLAHFDRLGAERCQVRVLKGLVHQAQGTAFGRAHDFSRIREIDDYRRLVPVTTPGELWRDYWRPALPNLGGTTWPGPLDHLVISPDEGTSPPWAVAFSAGHKAAQRAAWRTILALVHQARRPASFLGGTLLFLHEGALTSTGEGRVPFREVACEHLPPLTRPYALTAPVDTEFLEPLARHAARCPLTCLAGPAGDLEALLGRVVELNGRESAAEVWPGLAAVLYWRSSAEEEVEGLRRLAGPGVLFLEVLAPPGGIVAVEDPRWGALRPLPDHGVYCEFIPAGQQEEANPTRHGLGEVEPGITYELALTSPAGWWACRTGLTVRFERGDPPLMRLVAEPRPVRSEQITTGVSEKVGAFPQVPHRQNGDTPAGRPGNFVHIPWSTPWGRG